MWPDMKTRLAPVSRRRLLSLGAAAWLPAPSAWSQSLSGRPIRIVVPAAPGGFTDIVARLASIRLSNALGQQVVVENRQGAGSTIGADHVAKSAPDGHTLLMSSTTHVLGQAVYGRLPYDPIKSFAPVAKLVDSAYILVVHPGVKAQSTREFIALAKAQPDAIHFGSSGNGSSQHLTGALFNAMAGTQLKHVPYRGSSGATTDLLAGTIECSFAGVPNVLPFIQQGKLRALAVTTAKRIEQLPDVPTLAESGVPGYEASIWLALLAPAGTPAEIIQRFHAELAKGFALPETQKALFEAGVSPAILSPADTADLMQRDMQRWSKVIRDIGIKPD
jgi:tripartite-type tricarboxylate transporter receptor subunit TctC